MAEVEVDEALDDIDALLADDGGTMQDEEEESTPTFRVAAKGSENVSVSKDTDAAGKENEAEKESNLNESWADMMDEEDPIQTVPATELDAEASLPPRNMPLSSDPLERAIQYGKSKYSFKNRGSFAVGFDVTKDEENQKRLRREQRFGVVTSEKQVLQRRQDRFGSTNDSIGNLGKSKLLRTEPRVDSTIRPEALHVHGTENMSTKDIIALFAEYYPSHIEWINDACCNVVWADSHSSARALWALGIELPVEVAGRGASSVDATPDASAGVQPGAGEGSAAEASHVPPVLRWRRMIVPGAQRLAILIRGATTDDVKVFGAAKESKYYKRLIKKHGVKSKVIPRSARAALGKRMKRSSSKPSIEIPPGGLISRSRQLRESGRSPSQHAPTGDNTVETIDYVNGSAGAVPDKLRHRLGTGIGGVGVTEVNEENVSQSKMYSYGRMDDDDDSMSGTDFSVSSWT
eukprot:m.1348103 g.1348103  ORF g.1348103 m.1348103 type:complete len:462 (-) comp24914_c0_seq5:3276-4661(-)